MNYRQLDTSQGNESMARLDEFVVFSSELGWMGLSWSPSGVYGLTFGNAVPAQAARRLALPPRPVMPPARVVDELQERCQAFAQGQADDFLDVKLDLRATTPFQQRVLKHCRRIPYGETSSYQHLAGQAGSPAAARAVGNIMAKNRIPLMIPCHRVVAANGGLGGFSAPDGLPMKRRLLQLEAQGVMV